MAPRQTVVIRDGAPSGVHSAKRVPGDLLLLEAGNIVPHWGRPVALARYEFHCPDFNPDVAGAGDPIRENVAHKDRIASKKPLLGAIALTFALQLAAIYLPGLQSVLYTESLTAIELVACLAVLFAIEANRWAHARLRGPD
jgi:magnesium-transporting ATPase (P-type)